MSDPDHATILIVDDDRRMRGYVASLLRAQDYGVVEADSGEAGIQAVADRAPALVVLDTGLADMGAGQVLGRLRQWSDVPVVATAAAADTAAADVLDAGADDYMVRPFGTAEFLARIRVQLRHVRRRRSADAQPVVTTGNLVVDPVRRRVMVGDHPVEMTPTEYGVLLTLAKHVGQVVTHRQLLEQVWGPECVGRTHYLRVYMAKLRPKIEQDPSAPVYLVTEAGIGYRLRDYG